MNIDELLTTAGITDAEQIAKLKEAMPKAFMPLAEANKRIAAAKKDAEEAGAALEAYKAEQAKAAEEAAKAKQGEADELAALKEQHEALQKQFEDAQTKARQATGREALVKALKDGGANPAAVELLASSGLGRVEYAEDGKPANVQEIAAALKSANEGLFGTKVDTSAPQKQADKDNDGADAFLRGFGKLD